MTRSPAVGAESTTSASALAEDLMRLVGIDRSTAFSITATGARGSGKHGTAERSSPKASPIAMQQSTPAGSTTEIERLRAEALKPQTVRVTSRMRATAVRLADIAEREKRRADLYAAAVSCFLGGKR